MKIKMFVQTNAGVAQKPGVTQRNIRLSLVPPTEGQPNPNATAFASGNGAGVCDLQNVSAEVAEMFPPGAAIDVTIEVSAAPAA